MDFEASISSARTELRGALTPVQNLSSDDLATIFMMYDQAIRPNFIFWIQLVYANCTSTEALAACKDNLDCEVNENHPQMLLDFMLPVYTNFHSSLALGIPDSTIRTIRNLTIALTNVCIYQPMGGLTVLAVLENTSLDFINWMKQAAAALDISNQQYLNVHGEADIEHADEFVAAWQKESEAVKFEESEVQDAIYKTVWLLKTIFKSHLRYL